MTPKNSLLRIWALGSLVTVFVAGQAHAAFVALVPTAATSVSHSFDVVLDTEGSGLGAFDAFLSVVEMDCAGCIVGIVATDSTGAATGLFSSFTLGGNDVHYGGFSLSGLDVGPFAGAVVGSITVDHVPTGSQLGRIRLLISPDPPSGFVSAVTGPLPNSTCPTNAGCLLGLIIIPEPSSALLLGLGLAGLAFVRRYGPGSSPSRRRLPLRADLHRRDC